MTLTNKYNLPESLLNAVQNHEHKGGFLSASQTTKSPRQFWLNKRHHNEIVEDASERIWALLGTACHHVFEKNTTVGIPEKYLETTILDKTISGTADLYNDGKITDYKTTSVWSIIYMSNMSDWEKQLNTYAYLYRMSGYAVNEIEVVAILRDWQKSKAHEENYPNIQIATVKINLWTLEQQENYLIKCMISLIKNENIEDDKLPLCTNEQLWKDKDKFAVMKKGRKSALRLLPSQDDANGYIIDNQLDDKHYIEKRVEEAKRCAYCNGRDFCSQYKIITGETK